MLSEQGDIFDTKEQAEEGWLVGAPLPPPVADATVQQQSHTITLDNKSKRRMGEHCYGLVVTVVAW